MLQYWSENKIVNVRVLGGERIWPEQELVIAKFIADLRHAGVPLRTCRQFVLRLRRRFAAGRTEEVIAVVHGMEIDFLGRNEITPDRLCRYREPIIVITLAGH